MGQIRVGPVAEKVVAEKIVTEKTRAAVAALVLS